jgi:hypothetical protein
VNRRSGNSLIRIARSSHNDLPIQMTSKRKRDGEEEAPRQVTEDVITKETKPGAGPKGKGNSNREKKAKKAKTVATREEALKHFKQGRNKRSLDTKYAAFCDDRDVVMAAVNSQGANLKHVSPGLRADRKVVEAALMSSKSSGQYLKVADDVCKADYKLVRLAMKHSEPHNAGAALQHASDGIRGDKKWL